MKSIRNAVGLAAVAIAVAGTGAVVSPSIAQADPGRCAVSVQGPSDSGFEWAYFVRNVCSDTVNVKAHLYTLNMDSDCKWVGPNETVALFSKYIDQSWQAVPC